MKTKFIIFFAAFFAAYTANAQSDNFAELRNDILYLNNGAVLHEGDVLTLGNPTGCYENCFEYIFYEPEELFTVLTKSFSKHVYAFSSGEKVTIKSIKYIGKKGEKIWLLALNNNLRKEKVYCFLEKALDCGEIILSDVKYENNKSRNPIILDSMHPVEKHKIRETEYIKSEQNNKVKNADLQKAKQAAANAEREKREAEQARLKAENEAKQAKLEAEQAKKDAENARKKAEEEMKQAKKDAKKAAKETKKAATSTSSNYSVADEIRKLKSLMDEGIITKEEFEQQKSKLLK